MHVITVSCCIAKHHDRKNEKRDAEDFIPAGEKDRKSHKHKKGTKQHQEVLDGIKLMVAAAKPIFEVAELVVSELIYRKEKSHNQ